MSKTLDDLIAAEVTAGRKLATMPNYTHTLTDIEKACGVTLDDVARELPRGLFIENGAKFIVPENCGPALSTSVARCAFGGAPVALLGKSLAGWVYARA